MCRFWKVSNRNLGLSWGPQKRAREPRVLGGGFGVFGVFGQTKAEGLTHAQRVLGSGLRF